MFSVIVPVFRPEADHLRQCVESVVGQTYDGWQLILVADGPQPDAAHELLDNYSDHEQIVVVELAHNQGISAASQAGLERSTGEFIALLDHDDVLSKHALGAYAAELENAAPVDLAYSDEDKLEHRSGQRHMPFYKPGFSMERLRCQMYLGHLLVARREVVNAVGGFRGDFDGAQDHDLALRVAERARRVTHIPRVLYHWRESPNSTAMNTTSKDWAWKAGMLAVSDHLQRTRFPAVAERSPVAPGVVEIKPRLIDHPLVSVVIPTGGARRLIGGSETLLVERCLSTLVQRSTYPNLEIVVVMDGDSDDGLARQILRAAGKVPVEIVRDPRPFNFANACNIGVIRSAGEVVLFLNDDTEVCMDNWIERLVMYATRPGIGAVGAKLLYGDGRIQHAGVWTRTGGPAHRYVGFSGDHPGNFHALRLAQNCVAVTAACMAVERARFDEVGGFCPQYPLAYNDVDFCFKLLHRGYRNVVDCATEVIHHESSSRNPTVRDWEIERLNQRWAPLVVNDPFDNPANLAAGVDEYPATPVDVVDRKAQHGELVLAGRSWPDPDFYNLGTRRNG